MTSRNYDVILTVTTNSGSFTAGNNLIGNTTGTVGYIASVDTANNKIKVKLANSLQEYSTTERVHSNAITVTGTANGSLKTTSLPFQANTMSGNVVTAIGTVSASAPSTFIAEKNAFTQNPIVRLYSIYYPGEWYPPNAAGNPTGQGAGYAWPNDFPIRIAEIVGDKAEDISYNVTYGGVTYSPFPINLTGLEQASDGKINELSLSVFNVDNMISYLVENPYLAGINTSNSVSARVNGELVYGIDPRTVPGRAEYDASIVQYYGKSNATFDKTQTEALGGVWQQQKMDTRDLQGAAVEIKTTFANFLDYWPEYSRISAIANNIITVTNAIPYRPGDDVVIPDSRYNSAKIVSINNNEQLILNKPITKYKYLGAQDSTPHSIDFNSNGSKFFMLGSSGDRVYEYNLSTTWDISTATYNTSFSIATEENDPRSLVFGNSGYDMYVVGSTNDNVYRYSLTVPWGITTANLTQTFNIAAYEGTPGGIAFHSAGSNLYLVGSASDRVHQFNLAVAWDLSTASYLQNVSVAAQESAVTEIAFNSTGTRMYVVGITNDTVYEYQLLSAWNVATATLTSNLYVGGLDSYPTGVYLGNSNKTLYVIGNVNDNVHSISLTTASTLASVTTTVNTGTPLYIVNPQADAESYLEDRYKIDQLEGLSDHVASFGLVSWLQYFKIVTPKRKYYKNTCQWLYKGPECQYPGPGGLAIPGTTPTKYSNTNPIAANNAIASSLLGDVCAKSLTACTIRNNSIHFGGFPGVGRTVPQM